MDSDPHILIYKPKYNLITGSVLSSLLLKQMLYWWYKVGERPYFKFDAPCEHELYKAGDSWQEELGFSRSELETARKNIANKVLKGTSKAGLMEKSFIVYWVTRERVTFYEPNVQLIGKSLKMAYES
jgi:hypothetical protein